MGRNCWLECWLECWLFISLFPVSSHRVCTATTYQASPSMALVRSTSFDICGRLVRLLGGRCPHSSPVYAFDAEKISWISSPPSGRGRAVTSAL